MSLDALATRCRIREAIGVVAPPLTPEQVADDVTRLVLAARERSSLAADLQARAAALASADATRRLVTKGA